MTTCASIGVSSSLVPVFNQTRETTFMMENTTKTPLTLEILAGLDSCRRYGTCEFMHTRLLEENRYCHCDVECSICDDCCSDSNYTRNPYHVNKLYGCEPLKKNKDLHSKGCYVINKCPLNYINLEIEAKCLQNISITGPFVEHNGTIYKNKFCAECHDVKQFRFFALQIITGKKQYFNETYSSFNLLDYLSFYLSDPNIEYQLIAPEGVPMRYCSYTIPNANPSSECIAYTINPVASRHRGVPYNIYRNNFCKIEDGGRFRCLGYILMLTQNPASVYPLSILFSFSSTTDVVCHDGAQMVSFI